jgi:hypothetical protein
LVTISRTPFRTTNDMAPAKASFVRRAQVLIPRFSPSESGSESLIETLRRKETYLATRSTARPAKTPSASTITTVLSNSASTAVTVYSRDA